MSFIDKVSSSRIGTTQTIATTGTTAPITNAFGDQTRQIRVVGNLHFHLRIYDTTGTATATAADPLVPGLWEAYFTVSPGQKCSTIQAATAGLITAATGTVWVTEMT